MAQLSNYKNQSKVVNLEDNRNYEDRVRGLLQEMELMSKDHMMAQSQTQYRVTEGLARESELEQKLEQAKADTLEAMQLE